MIMNAYGNAKLFFFYLVVNLLPFSFGFSPAAAPRFDNFCDSIVASWHVPPTGETEPVDEVVRSCGGAIQGIREIPLADQFYLNRADDGFVFYDCGTYSHGPVVLDPSTSFKFMTSLSMANNFRVLLIGDLGRSENFKSSTVLCLPKATFRTKQNGIDTINLTEPKVISSAPHYEVDNEIQCRMPSPRQPWILQRSQWESHEVKHVTGEMTSSCDESDPHVSHLSWVEATNKGECIRMGSACTSSGQVKEIIRTYENGQLRNVIKKEGNLV
mmetsp:Transcript_15929/g.24125  ORF Transcript_15929/g.24125 Transcript_15929/m.24125 type:complete len:271 (-) Transcript_15929:228-1040(-)